MAPARFGGLLLHSPPLSGMCGVWFVIRLRLRFSLHPLPVQSGRNAFHLARLYKLQFTEGMAIR